MCELAKRITVPVTMDFMSVSSYGDGTQSSGIVKIAKDLDESLEGKDVIVVEDIVDSGRTLYYLLDILRKRGPKSMKLCTLLDKPDRRVRDVHVDYVGFNIPDEFVVIPMDAILIQQVLINILENAVQHAKGMVHLGLKVFLVADKAVFEVQDDGCGIPEEKLKSVFYGSHEAYEVSSDCKRSNAGIGLAVCATIIKAHGGKIKAENKKNGGALFRFYLDMEEKEQA